MATYILLLICSVESAYGANSSGGKNYGIDYAFLLFMAMSPDFSAANYTFHNDDGTNVDTSIARMPYTVDIMRNTASRVQIQVALAYLRTNEFIQTFPSPGERIDSLWESYGSSLGFLYEYNISERFKFTPSAHFGLARLQNQASYSGVLTNLIKDQYEGTLFNWSTNASVSNIGLGFSYNWKWLDRTSSIKADAYHVLVDSFDESNSAVEFKEHANMMTVRADMIFPTRTYLYGERLDIVTLLGANNFFGENRRTLGYTSSYQAGVGAEIPLKLEQSIKGHLRFSGQVLWAENMRGWLVSIGYNPQ